MGTRLRALGITAVLLRESSLAPSREGSTGRRMAVIDVVGG